MKLDQDTYSLAKSRFLYGKRGDDISVVAAFGHVLICEHDTTKQRFPVLRKQFEKMNTSLGKMLVLFTNQQIASSDKIAFNGGQLQIMRPFNPNDYSIETATVFAVSKSQHFFRAGDRVLVDYNIFQQGKFRERTGQRTRLFDVVEEGEVYWAFDGMDGWNKLECYGKITAENEVVMAENFCLVAPPKEALWSTNGSGLVVKQEQDRDKAFWAPVLASHPANELEAEVLVEGGLAQPIFFDGRQAAIVDYSHILAKRNANDTAVSPQ